MVQDVPHHELDNSLAVFVAPGQAATAGFQPAKQGSYRFRVYPRRSTEQRDRPIDGL